MTYQKSLYPNHIVKIATHYWGPENKELSRANDIRYGTNGSKSVEPEKGVWYDFERHEGGGVIDLIRREEPGANLSERLAMFGVNPNESDAKYETTWDYQDHEGQPGYQVVRIDQGNKKTYRQRRFAEDGGLIWNMDGVTPLPYRLPELLKSKDLVFIVEGEKCADALAKTGLTATTNHGGAGNWNPLITPYFVQREIVIIPDNDGPGWMHAKKVAAALHGVAKTIRIVSLPDVGDKGDVYDWIIKGGTREALLDLVNDAAVYSPDHPPQPPSINDRVVQDAAGVIQIFGWDELSNKEIKWLISGILPTKSFVALYGRPGSFKSFVAIYIATMIGSGNHAFGRQTRKGDVVYIAGEGAAGLKNRVDAIREKHGIVSAQVYFIPQQLNLRSTDQDRQNVVSAIKTRNIEPCLIIIDTLARAFAAGNENSSEDMGAFIGQIGKLQEELDTTVMIVHHSGKDESRGQRGHSSLLGAVDTELEVTRASGNGDAERIGQLTVTKQKDSEDGVRIGYRMDVVPLGLIDAGKSSLALVPMDIDEMREDKQKKKLSSQQNKALTALERAIEQDGKIVSLPDIPPNTRCVELKFWRSMFNAMHAGELEAQRIAFSRCLKVLQDSRTIGFWDNLVWISKG